MARRQANAGRAVVKLRDVAERAGYSVATASRVLNGNPRVGALERERVLAAAAQLGYVPNSSARALRSASTRLVGVIIPTLDHAIYATMVDGLQDRLGQKGVSVVVNTSGYDLDQELAQARLLVGRGVEAIVLVGAQHRPETLDYLGKAGVTRVFTYTNNLDGGDAAAGFDNRLSGTAAARFLLDLGHRRFGIIAGVTRDNDRARERLEGFFAELEKTGVAADSVVVLEAPYRFGSGRSAMQSIMQAQPRPTAVFCGSDVLAIGAIKYCHANGIAVPGDVSIVGFDNLEIAEMVSPELTTLDVPAREMGEATADLILSSHNQRAARVHELHTRLIARASAGPSPDPQSHEA